MGRKGLFIIFTLVAIAIIIISIHVTHPNAEPCDSSPQYFVRSENVSENGSDDFASGYSVEALLRLGYKTVPFNESLASRYPVILQGIVQQGKPVYINSSDVGELSERTRDSIFFYNDSWYLVSIAHYDRPACRKETSFLTWA